VCDRARQACPVFPGAGKMLHWDIEDPADVSGSDEEKTAAFRTAYSELHSRVEGFVAACRVRATPR
jgi:arsenate reductase